MQGVSGEQPSSPSDNEETERQRLNRNWNELLQELRVVQTGTQITTGFLLTAVFQSRFDELDTFQLSIYLALVATSILTTIAGLAPVSVHRALFRKRVKDRIIAQADRFAQVTLIGVAVTVIGIGLLLFDFVLGRWWGVAIALMIAATIMLAWIIVPRRVRAAAGTTGAAPGNR